MFWVLAYRIMLDWVAAVKFLFGGGVADFWAVTRAHFAFYRRIGTIRKNRKGLPRREVSQMYQRNIVFENFLKGRKTFTELDPEKFTHA